MLPADTTLAAILIGFFAMLLIGFHTHVHKLRMNCNGGDIDNNRNNDEDESGIANNQDADDNHMEKVSSNISSVVVKEV